MALHEIHTANNTFRNGTHDDDDDDVDGKLYVYTYYVCHLLLTAAHGCHAETSSRQLLFGTHQGSEEIASTVEIHTFSVDNDIHTQTWTNKQINTLINISKCIFRYIYI